MRLIHRDRAGTSSLEEGDCYDRSYGEHVLDHVDLLPLEHAEAHVELSAQDGEHHVTSAGLKRQFEQRLASRRRRSR